MKNIVIIFLIFNSIMHAGLIRPENDRELNYLHILFEWDQEPGAIGYNLQISNQSLFNNLLLDVELSSTIFIDKDNFNWDDNYYWRVRPVLDYEDSEYGDWIGINSFQIGDRAFQNLDIDIYNEELLEDGYSSITLTDLESGYHTFYLKARDIAGAESEIVQFPDIQNPSEPNYWKVLPVQGNVLLVDDFVQDSQNNAQQWYRSVLDTALGLQNYSVWEIGRELPYSSADLSATLNYFNHVIWYSAYTGIETYLDASANISNFIASGGNILLNAAELKDSTFVFFPLDSSFVLNPQGRIFAGSVLESQVSTDLDLVVSSLIAVRVRGFIPDAVQFATLQTLYNLADKPIIN